MPGLIETNQVGAREDLSSYIVNIEKTETPLFTMIPKDTVNKTHFETQVDDYGETDDIEGVGSNEDAEDFDDMTENRGLIENYVMKMWEKPMVDDFAENVNENPALTEGEYVNAVAKAIVRLKFRIEKQLLSQVQARVQATGAKYRSCSIGGFLSTSAPTGAQTIPSRFRTPSAQVYSSTLAAYDEDDSHGILQEVFEATHGQGKFTGIVCRSQAERSAAPPRRTPGPDGACARNGSEGAGASPLENRPRRRAQPMGRLAGERRRAGEADARHRAAASSVRMLRRRSLGQPQNIRHPEMRQSRKHYARNRKRLAQMRAAKERHRMARAAREEPMPDTSHVRKPRLKPSGFRVTIQCLDDGERVSFTAHRLPWGLSISPTLAGRKVSAVLGQYRPV